MLPDSIPRIQVLPCGSIATFDYGSGIGYRCEICLSIVGSIGMPVECKKLLDEEAEAEMIIKILKGRKNGSV